MRTFILIAAAVIATAVAVSADPVVVKLCSHIPALETMTCEYNCSSYLWDTTKGCFQLPGYPDSFKLECQRTTPRCVFGTIFTHAGNGTCNIEGRHYAIEDPCDTCMKETETWSRKLTCVPGHVEVNHFDTADCTGTGKVVLTLEVGKCNARTHLLIQQPAGFRYVGERTVTVVSIGGVTAVVGNDQIGVAVIIQVARGATLSVSVILQARGMCDVFKGPIAAIAKQPVRVRTVV